MSAAQQIIKIILSHNLFATNSFKIWAFSQVYLSRVGIILSDAEMNRIFESLSKLKLLKAICAKNRYWDPIDLNNLYQKRNLFQLPTSVTEFRLSYTIKALLQTIKDNFPVYYFKYFGIENLFRKRWKRNR